MDERAFDRFTTAVVAGASRRAIVKALLGGSAGSLLALVGGRGPREAEAVCTAYLKSCTSNGQCCTGYCGPTKRCRCAPGTTRCGGACVPTASFQSDPANCGGCGVACASTGFCVSGICTVPACAPPGGYGPGVSTSGLPCEAVQFTWTTRPGTDFYVISIDGVAEPATTGTSLTKTGLPRKATGSYQYCFQQGKNGCPDLSVPVCGAFNTRGCAT